MRRRAWFVLWLVSLVLLVPASLLVAPHVLIGRLHAWGLALARPSRYCQLRSRGWVQVGPLWKNERVGLHMTVNRRVRR